MRRILVSALYRPRPAFDSKTINFVTLPMLACLLESQSPHLRNMDTNINFTGTFHVKLLGGHPLCCKTRDRGMAGWGRLTIAWQNEMQQSGLASLCHFHNCWCQHRKSIAFVWWWLVGLLLKRYSSYLHSELCWTLTVKIWRLFPWSDLSNRMGGCRWWQWIESALTNSHVEILMLSVMVLGSGVFGGG